MLLTVPTVALPCLPILQMQKLSPAISAAHLFASRIHSHLNQIWVIYCSAQIPGWEVVNEDKLTFHKGSPSELRGRFAPQVNSYYALKSSGLLDNFDASVNIKFTEGDKEWIRAGFYTRFTSSGGYGFMVSAQASYMFGSFVKDEKGELVFQKMMAWAYHSALQPGLNKSNRLRVICNGDSFRVYLNGVLAGSFKDSKFAVGKLHLAVEPSAKSAIEVAFSDLQLREVPK
jgi:hypothetical protein